MTAQNLVRGLTRIGSPRTSRSYVDKLDFVLSQCFSSAAKGSYCLFINYTLVPRKQSGGADGWFLHSPRISVVPESPLSFRTESTCSLFALVEGIPCLFWVEDRSSMTLEVDTLIHYSSTCTSTAFDPHPPTKISAQI